MNELIYRSVGNLESLQYYLPELSLLGVFLVVFFIDLATGRERSRAAGPVAVVGLAVVAAVTLWTQMRVSAAGEPGVRLFFGMVAADPIATFFKLVFLAAVAVTILMTLRDSELTDRRLGEYYSLLLLLTMGLFFMASSTNLLMFYIALEVASYLSYVLVGFVKGQIKSSEASLKYVLYGSVSSGAMLFGISIIYGLTGTLDLFALAGLLSEVPRLPLLVATFLIMVGIGYKISAVPFHFWTPDVYEGANTPMTAFLSVASKAAGFALLIRFIFFGTGAAAGDAVAAIDWQKLLIVLSVLTMTVGNLVAIHQRSMKRLLAYSSIAHAGYILMGLTTLNQEGLFAALFYIAVYLFMNLGAFLVVIALRDRIKDEDDIGSYFGLGARFPAVAVMMGVFLFSLTGLPPTAGFIGKFYLFAAVIRAGLYELAVIGVLNSVVSLYYYARILRAMFLASGEEVEQAQAAPGPLMPAVTRLYSVLLVVLAVPTVLLGIYWNPLAQWVEKSVRFLF
ncbi:MAG: NADH-quinone oxidoreductase subunit NuoN [Candidatus Eisenbacteria bacterium]|nr:NADH-quinone oxidoreductase subunit NuoN [Candidatus Eisenbacteria bacterium]